MINQSFMNEVRAGLQSKDLIGIMNDDDIFLYKVRKNGKNNLKLVMKCCNM
jgi:hypothetical protein